MYPSITKSLPLVRLKTKRISFTCPKKSKLIFRTEKILSYSCAHSKLLSFAVWHHLRFRLLDAFSKLPHRSFGWVAHFWCRIWYVSVSSALKKNEIFIIRREFLKETFNFSKPIEVPNSDLDQTHFDVWHFANGFSLYDVGNIIILFFIVSLSFNTIWQSGNPLSTSNV